MIVVDTHVMIWHALKPEMLSKKARQIINRANHSGGIICCDISLWEIAMLMHKGRLQVDAEFLEFIQLILESGGYKIQAITPEIADLSVNLFSKDNQDPADRIIAATAIEKNSELVTADKNLRRSSRVNTVW